LAVFWQMGQKFTVFSTGNEKKGITVFSSRDPDKKQGNGARFGLILLRGSVPHGPRVAPTGDRGEEDASKGAYRPTSLEWATLDRKFKRDTKNNRSAATSGSFDGYTETLKDHSCSKDQEKNSTYYLAWSPEPAIFCQWYSTDQTDNKRWGKYACVKIRECAKTEKLNSRGGSC
jgi:hypothetical protein